MRRTPCHTDPKLQHLAQHRGAAAIRPPPGAAWRVLLQPIGHRRGAAFMASVQAQPSAPAPAAGPEFGATAVLEVDPRSFPWPTSSTCPSAIDSDSVAPVSLAASPPTATYQRDLGRLRQAAALLKQHEVVAIPTETVYGLAADALSEVAVRKIYAAKQRPSDNPLIIHISSLDMLRSLYPDGSAIPDVYAPVLAAHWPGPLTVLLPRSPLVPECVTCGQPTMAVRMPSHPVARTLISLCGVPLAAPSANSSGRPSPTLAAHVLEDLRGRLPLVIDGGACSFGLESTVLDALRRPPAILRPGGVTYEQLLGCPGLEGLQVGGARRPWATGGWLLPGGGLGQG
jgi:L-threonylcarbamoyladenylate synthase